MQANTNQSHPSAFMSNQNREKKISNVPGASSSSTCRRCRTPQCGPTPQRPLAPRRRTRSAPTRPGRHPLAPRRAGPRRRARSTLARADTDAERAAPPRGPPTPDARRPFAVPRRRSRGAPARASDARHPALLHARPGGRAGTDPRGGRRRPAGGPRCGGALGFRGGRAQSGVRRLTHGVALRDKWNEGTIDNFIGGCHPSELRIC